MKQRPRRPSRVAAAKNAPVGAREPDDTLNIEVFSGRVAEVIRDRDLQIDALLPLATTGKKVRDAHLNRQSQQDRAAFLRIGGELRKRFPELDRNALLVRPELADLVERWPERVAVWVRDLYPKLGRGRPLKRK